VNQVRSQLILHSDAEAAADGSSDRLAAPGAETPGTPERAGSLQRDAPSAGSARTAWGGRLDASSQEKEEKADEIVLYSNSYDEFSAKENESAPELQLDDQGSKALQRSSLVKDMRTSGFSSLPALQHEIRSDEYLRYGFDGKDLIPVHEDYFRVLRACAKVLSVYPEVLHRCVQRVEKGLMQVECNVEKFLLSETDLNVVQLARNFKWRRRRIREKAAAAEQAKERSQHLRDLRYL
jgi:hypothetical protein